MNFQQFIKKSIFVPFTIAAFAAAIFAQSTQSSINFRPATRSNAVATGNNLYCAGYIGQDSISTRNRIVGGDDEADKYNYDEHDFLYINMGANKGVNVGDVFSVVRPRGQVESRWTRKNDIGYYVQEVGAVEVINVKPEVSVVRVKVSCDSILLGDLIQYAEKRTSPLTDMTKPFDIFADPSGKAQGRIVMSRDGAEMLTRDYIAYVDLGAEDNVKVGDRLTVFRPLGTGNLFEYPVKESVSARDEGFQSDEYRGGKFSNQASRKQGGRAKGRIETTHSAKRNRPDLRKVVGEAVVLNVKEKTATVVITRTAQEIHTGDWVEIQ